MRYLLVLLSAVLLAGCASFSGTSGQFQTNEVVQLAKPAQNYHQGVISVGEQLGYQYTGGDRNRGVVRLADQPNFGQSMMGRAFTVQMTLTLQNDGRAIEVLFTSVGDRSSGAQNSLKRLRELETALQAQFSS